MTHSSDKKITGEEFQNNVAELMEKHKEKLPKTPSIDPQIFVDALNQGLEENENKA